MANSDLLSGLVGSLVGGLLSLSGALLGANHQHKKQTDAANAAERKQIAGFLGALEAELTVLWARYVADVRPHILAVPQDGMLVLDWPVEQDYFVVYAANAGLLGRLPDPNLRSRIVNAYTSAKGIVESIKFNAGLMSRLVEIQSRPQPLSAFDQTRETQLRSALVEYARSLKTSDAQLSDIVGGLLPRLQALATSSDNAPTSQPLVSSTIAATVLWGLVGGLIGAITVLAFVAILRPVH